MADPIITNNPDGSQCVTYPATPGSSGSPARYDQDPLLGWNAAARSIASEDGDSYVQWDMPPVVGVVVGLAPDLVSTSPNTSIHGMLFENTEGNRFATVIESGVKIGSPIQIQDDDVFRIELAGSKARYMINGAQVASTHRKITGTHCVVAFMYSAEDGVGRAD